jgi:hypothetical protein
VKTVENTEYGTQNSETRTSNEIGRASTMSQHPFNPAFGIQNSA